MMSGRQKKSMLHENDLFIIVLDLFWNLAIFHCYEQIQDYDYICSNCINHLFTCN